MPKAEKAPEQLPPEIAELDKKPQPDQWDQVVAAVHAVASGDASSLRVVLETYPDYRDRIIEEAQSTLGNATVRDALAMITGGITADQMHAMVDSEQDVGSGTPNGGAAPTDMPAATMKEQVDQEVAPPPTDLSVDDMKHMVDDEQDVGAGTPTLGPAPNDVSRDEMKKLVSAGDTTQADPDAEWKTIEVLVWALEKPKELASLLKAHPNIRAHIIEEAHKELSDDDIAVGIAMADAPTEAAPADAPAVAQTKEEGPKPGDAPTAAPEPEKEKEPAWVSRARQYNDANFDLAEKFNMATSFSCMCPGLDEELALDPIAISNWQQQNGIPPDGRIGPKTVEVAVSLKKQATPQVAGVDPDVMDEFKGDNQLE